MARYCTYCGTSNMDDGTFCTRCGKRLNVVAAQTISQPTVEIKPQEEYISRQMPPEEKIKPEMDMPMRWYKFIIWVQLFLAALVCAGQGLMMMTGSQYETELTTAKQVYEMFPGLETIDLIFGFLMVCQAVYAVIVRQQLAHFKQKSPMKYLIFMGVNIAISLLYTLAETMIINSSGIEGISAGGMSLGQIPMSVALLIINYNYFKNREHLFIR